MRCAKKWNTARTCVFASITKTIIKFIVNDMLTFNRISSRRRRTHSVAAFVSVVQIVHLCTKFKQLKRSWFDFGGVSIVGAHFRQYDFRPTQFILLRWIEPVCSWHIYPNSWSVSFNVTQHFDMKLIAYLQKIDNELQRYEHPSTIKPMKRWRSFRRIVSSLLFGWRLLASALQNQTIQWILECENGPKLCAKCKMQ